MRFSPLSAGLIGYGETHVIVRRMYSVPEHITLFGAAAAMAGAAYPTVMAHTGGHGVPCPLRALTGVPCPFCGLTTATVALTHGEWATAVRTSPLACLAAALVLGTIPLMLARAVGKVAPPRPWAAAARQRTRRIVAVVVAASWIFELRRYGYL
jgi:hypothetical protein